MKCNKCNSAHHDYSFKTWIGCPGLLSGMKPLPGQLLLGLPPTEYSDLDRAIC